MAEGVGVQGVLAERKCRAYEKVAQMLWIADFCDGFRSRVKNNHSPKGRRLRSRRNVACAPMNDLRGRELMVSCAERQGFCDFCYFQWARLS
jgi:hypothetical protein